MHVHTLMYVSTHMYVHTYCIRVMHCSVGVEALLFLSSKWIWAIGYGEGVGDDFSNERN